MTSSAAIIDNVSLRLDIATVLWVDRNAVTL